MKIDLLTILYVCKSLFNLGFIPPRRSWKGRLIFSTFIIFENV